MTHIDPNTLWPNVIEGAIIGAMLLLGLWWIGWCILQVVNVCRK